MMADAGRGSSLLRSWLPGALTLFLLTACATTPAAQTGAPSDAVDIGYGEVERDHQLGEVPTVNGDEEGAPQFRSLIEMLSRVPGVRVIERAGGEMSVRIRGSTSFMANEEPLFVVDGMAVQSAEGIMNMNSNTIASITVLKDAGDTAIYGSRGANGVILIRTKR